MSAINAIHRSVERNALPSVALVYSCFFNFFSIHIALDNERRDQYVILQHTHV